jgi:flagellar L-ring protein precursor FlgH
MKFLVPALLAVTLIAPCGADSLFPVNNAEGGAVSASGISLFSDTKAHRVGDILTIMIDENSSAASNAGTKTSKTESMNTNQGVGPNIVHIGSLQLGLGQIPALGLGDSTSSNASGTTTRSDNLSAEIEVVIKEILPNGNYSVEGTRSVGMNAETQTLTLTGVIRPEDIAANNTVQSPEVADANIKYGGKGVVSEKQHDGLITRVFRFLF